MSNPFRSLGRMAADQANPHRGATPKDVEVAQVAFKKLHHDIWTDEFLASEILAGGKLLWINTFMREFAGFRLVDREMGEAFWRFCHEQHGQKHPTMTPAQVMDKLHIASPVTAADIRQAFKFESASSFEARTRYYGPDGNPDQFFRRLVDQIADDDLLKAAKGEGGLELTPPADVHEPLVTLE